MEKKGNNLSKVKINFDWCNNEYIVKEVIKKELNKAL